MFIAKLATKKKIWKPSKFKPSRKVKIAENYDDLLK